MLYKETNDDKYAPCSESFDQFHVCPWSCDDGMGCDYTPQQQLIHIPTDTVTALGMWRIPNPHPNPTESNTFLKSEIRQILKIRSQRIYKLLFQSNLFTVYTIIFITNSSTLIDGGLLCFLYVFENNHNYFNYSLLVRLKLFNFSN